MFMYGNTGVHFQKHCNQLRQGQTKIGKITSLSGDIVPDSTGTNATTKTGLKV